MSPRFAAALLALLLAVAAGGVGGVAAQEETPTNATLPPEETVIQVQLQVDGDARWQITEQFVITDEDERRAFDDVGADFEAGRVSPLGLDTFQRARDDVAGETDRPMQIRDVDRNATLEGGTLNDARYVNGTMTLSFTWTNFAREVESEGQAEGEEDVVTYEVGDVFNTSQGTWFGGITAEERLVISLPERTSHLSTPKFVEDRAMTWDGPASFPPGYLTIEYNTRVEPALGLSLAWMALLVAAVASFGAGILLVRRRGVDPVAAVKDALAGPVVVDGTDDESEAVSEGDGGAGEEADDGLELLSDEERVERLLEENGGRMKQANIVKETGWSNAKVSQLLSAMEDEGRIAKLRIGRENLISFPEEDVGEFES